MKKTKKAFWFIYFLGFLWAFAYALPLYVQSSFVESFVGVENVGAIIFVGTVATLLAMMSYPYLIKRFHNYRIAVAAVMLFLISIIFLITAGTIWALVFYIMVVVAGNIFSINLDIFLENISNDRTTGAIRTSMLTTINIAILISPMIMGFIVGDNNFKRVYMVAGVVYLPILLLLFYYRKLIEDKGVYYKRRTWHALKRVFLTHQDLLRIFSSEFSLRFFYATMVLYVPIYLRQQIGFSWSQIGAIFTIMLLPFVLLQMPAGRIADKWLGEKEMLLSGIALMALFSLVVFFLRLELFWVWAFVLFMTRVGAALVEAMDETYFFKKVDKEDMDLINIFRYIRPLGWLSAAAVSYVILIFFPLSYVFGFLALVLIIAMLPVFALKDTK